MEWNLNQRKVWQEANQKVKESGYISMQSRMRNVIRWYAPTRGSLKLNVDASIIQGTSLFAVGWVLRDHTGEFKGGRVERFQMSVSVLEAEAIGINEALSWVMDKTDAPVCVETDSLSTVQAITKGNVYKLELGHIFDECRQKLPAMRDLSVTHVKCYTC